MPLLVVAVMMPQVQRMAVVMVAEVPAAVMTATMAAMAAAGGYVTRGRKRGGGQRNGGNGGKEWSCGFHGRCGDEAIGGCLDEKDPPGRSMPGRALHHDLLSTGCSRR